KFVHGVGSRGSTPFRSSATGAGRRVPAIGTAVDSTSVLHYPRGPFAHGYFARAPFASGCGSDRRSPPDPLDPPGLVVEPESSGREQRGCTPLRSRRFEPSRPRNGPAYDACRPVLASVRTVRRD